MNLAILGATGSIGSSTLDVVARHPDRYRVFALTANGKAQPLLELCRVHRPALAVLSGAAPDAKLAARFAQCGTELLFGAAALDQVVADRRCPMHLDRTRTASLTRPMQGARSGTARASTPWQTPARRQRRRPP